MLLSKDDREKFIRYLSESIESDKMMVEQMKKMDMPNAVYNMMETRVIAYTIVLKNLETIEEQIIR